MLKEESIEDTHEYSLEKEENIGSVLKKLPEIIRQKEEILLQNEILKGEHIAKTKTIEENTARAVASEKVEEEQKDGSKKLVNKYTNDMQRSAQVNTRLINHKEYNIKRDAADKLDRWIQKEKIIVSYLKRLHNSAGYLALLKGDK